MSDVYEGNLALVKARFTSRKQRADDGTLTPLQVLISDFDNDLVLLNGSEGSRLTDSNAVDVFMNALCPIRYAHFLNNHALMSDEERATLTLQSCKDSVTRLELMIVKRHEVYQKILVQNMNFSAFDVGFTESTVSVTANAAITSSRHDHSSKWLKRKMKKAGKHAVKAYEKKQQEEQEKKRTNLKRSRVEEDGEEEESVETVPKKVKTNKDKKKIQSYFGSSSRQLRATKRTIIDSGAYPSVLTQRLRNVPCIPTDVMVTGIDGRQTLSAACIGTHPVLGVFAHVPDADLNLLSAAAMTEAGCSSLTCDKSTCQLNVKNKENVVAERSMDGLYELNPQDFEYLVGDRAVANVSRINSQEQIDRAKEFQRLHIRLGHPGDRVLMEALKNGCILGTHLVSKDVPISRSIVGLCPQCLAGKAVIRHVGSSTSYPADAIGQNVCVDLLPMPSICVGGFTFYVLSVDEFTGYLVAIGIRSKHHTEVASAFDELISLYKSNQHTISNIMADHESVFVSVGTWLGHRGIKLNLNAPYDHQKRIERYVRTINDRIRSILCGLNYVLPAWLYGELLQYVLYTINSLPNSIHSTEAPRQMVVGNKLDTSAELLPFGITYMFSHKGKGTLNKRSPRMELGIALGPSFRSKGSVRTWLVQSKMILNRRIRDAEFVVTTAQDLHFEQQEVTVPSSIPDFINLRFCSQQSEGIESTLEGIAREEITEDDVASASVSSVVQETEDNPTSETDVENETIDMVVAPSHRYNTRSRSAQPTWGYSVRQIRAFKGSIRQQLNGKRSAKAEAAAFAEIKQLLDYQVGHYLHYEDIPKRDRRSILQVFMLIDEKFHPDGSFDKHKARIVTNGKLQGRHLYDVVSSVVVHLSSIFLILNIASYLCCHLISWDIKGAFLNVAFQPTDPRHYVRIDKKLAELWVRQDPSAASFLNTRGELFMELDKFLYGLRQSPLKFQQHLTQTLLEAGYQQQVQDECIFIKISQHGFCIISTHVDDLLQVTTSLIFVEELRTALLSRYESIVCHQPCEHYLGMSLRSSDDRQRIYVSQFGLTTQVLEYLSDVSATAMSPCSNDLFKSIGDDDTAPSFDRNLYLTVVMKLMYLARLTRPDILLAVTYLATKSANPTRGHWRRVQRVLKYLNNTPNFGVEIHCFDLTLFAYCDASFGSHSDGSGHGGYLILFGEHSYVSARSYKLRVTGTSSSDAEIITSIDCIKTLVWMYELLLDLGFDEHTDVPHILLDNKANIDLLDGSAKVKKVMHLRAKVKYGQDMIRDNLVVADKVDTELNDSDLLTKEQPVQNYISEIHRLCVYDLTFLDSEVSNEA